MAFSLSRLTAYAIISSLEEDLREFINSHLSHLENNELFGEELLQRTLQRAESDFGIIEEEFPCDVLVHYTDFGDLISLIRRNKR